MTRFTRLIVAAFVTSASCAALAGPELLNVSYDVMRDFYKDLNPAFVKAYRAKMGEDVVVQQSHGGSGKQARAVIDGLEADVITMNMPPDIDALYDKAKLVPENWAARLPNDSLPFTSLQVLIVRKGNPKQIKDWSDLIKPDVQVVMPNPKVTGNGRYSYLAAWGYALKQPGGSEQKAREFVAAILKNVPVLDSGGRAATTTFMQRGIGDVLLTFENEAEMIAREFGHGGFEVIYPSLSVRAEPPVTLVDKVVDKKGTRKQAEEYLKFLWTPAAQEIAAQNYLRPQDPTVARKYASQFPAVKLFTVEEVFGGWRKAQKTHFDDGGSFDQVYARK
ncbi:sulfate ABC transporter substrate-binding protein [Chitinimonas sp. BJB300]|uniref:sulfate ABC transporter substrate-binding protein n=1 Tax=Chitinimonas sp. BJB300 TaxID=1559339 RepID=UPI000C10742F|nr:sulfate ABC transporter substrate-binding protein [Chitinimonas sp. BJB300]PHV10620.1 thiosulfate transporter subunit [Chitinimonas sp. BJB300]TSJ87695.1 sulfate ABC transporter substrate-binding protein [Chitinimonas sp. BJB300]